jgi:hypothetical protein
MLGLVEHRAGIMPEPGELDQFWVPVGPKPYLLVGDSQMRAAGLAWRMALDTQLWFPVGIDTVLPSRSFDLIVVLTEIEELPDAALNRLATRQSRAAQTIIYDRLQGDEELSWMELARDFRATLKRHGVTRY